MYHVTGSPRHFLFPTNALIGEGRGVPCIFHLPKGAKFDATIDIYGGSQLFINNQHTLTPSCRADMNVVLAVTSALLGVLADYTMRTRLNRRSRGFLDFFLRWRRLREPRLTHLAPLVKISEVVSVRMCDGALWDGHALCSTLRGLQFENLLDKHPAIIIVSATPVFAYEWWNGFRKQDIHMPECTLFSGDLRDNRVQIVRYGKAVMHVYDKVRIHDITALPKWFRHTNASIDLHILYIPTPKLNSIAFNKQRSWKAYQRFTRKALAQTCRKIKVRRDQPIGLAIASGGARSAVLGVETLRYLKRNRMLPTVVGGSSGGAWAIALYGVLRSDTCVVDYLFHNIDSLNRDGLLFRIAMAAVRALEGSEMSETSLFVIGILRRYDYRWSKFVNLLLFGATDAAWSSLNLPFRVAIAGTILSHSHLVE